MSYGKHAKQVSTKRKPAQPSLHQQRVPARRSQPVPLRQAQPVPVRPIRRAPLERLPVVLPNDDANLNALQYIGRRLKPVIRNMRYLPGRGLRFLRRHWKSVTATSVTIVIGIVAGIMFSYKTLQPYQVQVAYYPHAPQDFVMEKTLSTGGPNPGRDSETDGYMRWSLTPKNFDSNCQFLIVYTDQFNMQWAYIPDGIKSDSQDDSTCMTTSTVHFLLPLNEDRFRQPFTSDIGAFTAIRADLYAVSKADRLAMRDRLLDATTNPRLVNRQDKLVLIGLSPIAQPLNDAPALLKREVPKSEQSTFTAPTPASTPIPKGTIPLPASVAYTGN